MKGHWSRNERRLIPENSKEKNSRYAQSRGQCPPLAAIIKQADRQGTTT